MLNHKKIIVVAAPIEPFKGAVLKEHLKRFSQNLERKNLKAWTIFLKFMISKHSMEKTKGGNTFF